MELMSQKMLFEQRSIVAGFTFMIIRNSCKQCGGIINLHYAVCSDCGEKNARFDGKFNSHQIGRYFSFLLIYLTESVTIVTTPHRFVLMTTLLWVITAVVYAFSRRFRGIS
jgi:hypothetical protein